MKFFAPVPRRLLHIPRHTLRLLVYAAAVGVIIFFGLTRSEVGRDALRQQIEQQFDARFAGRLEIGRLTGNLVQTLYARDVRLLDPDGRVVVHVDSLVARPVWQDLFRQRLTIGSLTLFRPTLRLHYAADSTWNLADVFRSRRPGTPRADAAKGTPWDFDSADLRVVEGRVITTRASAMPPLAEAGWLFDYADAEVRDIALEATVEWYRPARLIDVLAFSASIPTIDFDIDALQGQVFADGSRLSLSQIIVQAEGTDLRLGGVLENRNALRQRDFEAVRVEAEIAPSRVDFDALRRLVPRLPVADDLALAGRLAGPLDALRLDDFFVQRGASRLAVSGGLRSLPDSLGFDLRLRDSRLAAADLAAVVPSAELSDFTRLGLVRLAGTVRGAARRSPRDALRLRAEADLDVRGAPGHLAGTIRLGLLPDRAARYDFALDADSLDLGIVSGDPALASTLNGRLVGRGRGLSFDSLAATLRADLYASRFAGRYADTLHAEIEAAGRRLDATAFLRQGGGGIFGTGFYDARAARPRYGAGLFTRRLDLGPLLGLDSLRSAFDAHLTLDGQGLAWADARGTLTVRIDSSSILGWKQTVRRIAPSTWTLQLAEPGAEVPRVALTSEALALRLDGDVGAALPPVLRLWQQTFADAVTQQLDKPYPRDGAAARLARAGTPPPPPPRLRRQARAALDAARLDALALSLAFEIKQAELLAGLLPMLAPPATDLVGTLDVRAGADRLRLDARLDADSLATPDFRADAFRARLRADASLDAPLATSLTATAEVAADSLAAAGRVFENPKLALRFAEQAGRLELATGLPGDPADLVARLTLLPDRNRVVLDTVRLALGDYAWATDAPHQIDLFRDATVFPGLTLATDTGGRRQHISLSGVLSRDARDSLFVELGGIALEDLTEAFSIAPALGGDLGGRLTLTRARQPELTGTLAVEGFSLDGFVLGNVAVESRYVPGLPDVLLDLDLTPLPPGAPTPAVYKPSDLHLGGTFRLPGGGDPGALDLRLDARGVDAFALERYVFDDILDGVRGRFTGAGTIQGTFRKPLFDAALRLDDGYFEVPEFNLRYTLEGPVRVDREGISLDDVRLADPTGGTARIAGTIYFNDYRYFSFGLRGRLDELQIIDVPTSRELPFYGQIWASGTATLTGPIYQALLRSDDAVTSARSDVFIPLTPEAEGGVDPGFIVFTDSTGRIPDVQRPVRRKNILSSRPIGERDFLGGLEMDLNIFAPQGSTVHLVIDPLLGDVINAVGSGRIQLQRREGEFFTYGALEADDGDYLFTAGEVFVRRFLIDEGTITWDGDPLDARLDIDAAYQTRAGRAGLPPEIASRIQSSIPLVVRLNITGRVSTPVVALDLALDRSSRETISNAPFLEAYLNQPDRAAQHATSVLLTNSFVLSTESTVLTGSAFNSVSQLVSSQLNRYLSQVVPNADFSFGLQGDERTEELDLTAGLAIRLLDERLVIRGQGVYRGLGTNTDATTQQGLLGEFVVEIRLNESVSVEVFYRRENDILSETLLTNETGAGVSYEAQFPTWRRLYHRIFGRPPEATTPTAADTTATPAADVGTGRE